MRLFSGPGFSIGDTDNNALINGWIARILCDRKHWKEGYCLHDEAFEHTELLEVLGLEDRRIARRRTPPPEMRQLATASLEKAWEEDRAYRNLSRLGHHLGMNEAEVRIMVFAFHMEYGALLPQAARLVTGCSRRKLLIALSGLLELPQQSLARALGPESLLKQLDLVEVNLGRRLPDLDDALQFNDNLGELVSEDAPDDTRLMSLFFRPGAEPRLDMAHFQAYRDDLEIIIPVLRQALLEERPGTNILLHGSPGTGKTELSCLLAHELGVQLAIVPETDHYGDALQPHTRLSRLTGCQRALRERSDTLLLFDEAEDVICDPGFSLFRFNSGKTASKASLNRLLESNRTPVIWISNTTENVDPAYLRRFTYALELGTPGPGQRKRTLARVLESRPVSEDTLTRLAKHDQVSPALAATALRTATDSGAGPERFESVFLRGLGNHLNAMGAPRVDKARKGASLRWRADCINADVDMAGLLDELDPETGVRFCLYGPPGTGKTAWGHQLAEKLGRPLMIKRVAELESCYVGQTEKNIARAFSQAEADNAVLLIDEADSFLDDRRNARQSWQISQVNQFLTSMEEFDGFLVCTTNFDQRMDMAAMRRFDFRVGFDYLTEDMAVLLFRDLCELAETIAPGDQRLRGWLSGMHRLTPGDFHVLARRLGIRKEKPSAEALFEQLRSECAYKEDEGRAIGFQAEIH
jgi:transitional endoplasmic reticulum ATPase